LKSGKGGGKDVEDERAVKAGKKSSGRTAPSRTH